MKEKDLKLFIGNAIKTKRIENGFRQEDIGQVLKLSRTSIINIESGRHSPTLNAILNLCMLFKCTPNDLFPPVKAIKWVIEEKSIKVDKKVKRLKIIKS